MKEKSKKKNILLFFLKMIVIYIIFDLIMFEIYPIISEMILHGKYGRNVVIEGICALLILIVILMFGNSYIFTDKKEKFIKSLGVGGFILGFGTIMLTYSIFSISAESNISIIDIGSLGLFCILIGIFEEFLCRGWILNEFVERFSSNRKQVILSILLSSLIFGLIHISNIWVAGQSVTNTISQIIQATGIGVCLGAVYLRTKNIWSVAFLHGYWDFAIFLREINVIKECTTVNVTLESKIVTIITSTILSLIFIVVAMYVFRKSKTRNIIKNENLTEEEIRKSERKNELYIVAIVLLFFSMNLLPQIEDEEVCYEYKEKEVTYYEKSYSNYNKYIIENKLELSITKDKKLSIKNLQTNDTNYFEKDSVYSFVVVENNNNYKILIRAINEEGNDTKIYYSDFIITDKINDDSSYLQDIAKSFIYLDTAPTTYEIGFISSLDDNNNYPFIQTSDGITLIYFEKDFYILKQKEVVYPEVTETEPVIPEIIEPSEEQTTTNEDSTNTLENNKEAVNQEINIQEE